MDVLRGRWAWFLLLPSVCLGVVAVRFFLPGRAPLAALAGPPTRDPLANPGRGDAHPVVRVLLGSTSRPRWKLKIGGPYRITAPGGNRVLAEGDRLGSTDVVAERGGLRIGERAFSEPRLRIDVRESGSLWVDGHRYRGDLTLARRAGEQIAAVNLVDLEDYVASVINGEMPASFPPPARQAQAIAARSYALFQMKASGAGKDFDVYDSARSQVYQGMETTDAKGQRLAVETDDARRVAKSTRGMVLLYQGRPFCPFFSAVCGGHTARGQDQFRDAAPPLSGVPCGHCEDGPHYRWQVDVPREATFGRLAAYLKRTGHEVGEIQSIACADPLDGRLPTVTVHGRRGMTTLTSAMLRQEVLSGDMLPSPFFSIETGGQSGGEENRQRLVIRGRGWGHGVGMCQWGARGMALSGSDEAAILAHYYPGSTVAVTP